MSADPVIKAVYEVNGANLYIFFFKFIFLFIVPALKEMTQTDGNRPLISNWRNAGHQLSLHSPGLR